VKPKFIFFDIDGTLLDHEKNLPDSAKDAILALKKEGHHVAIATGRGPFMFTELRKELGIDSFVSFNGQYVEWEGQPIYTNPISVELLEEVHRIATQHQHPVVFMDHAMMKSNFQYHKYVDEGLSSLKLKHPEYDPDFMRIHPVYQCLLFCTSEEEQVYLDRFPQQLQLIRWHTVSTDILPYGGSKARGIEVLMKLLHIDPEDVYAFGDNLNDLEMLSFVKHSVAMGNAPDIVKQKAKYVTKDVAEDGIYHGLKMLQLL